MQTQREKTEKNRRKMAEDMDFIQIRIWVPRGEADAIKAKYKAKRAAERDRLKRILKHKAMNEGKRPSGRPSNAEVAIEIKERLLTKLINE